jgi:hypothetical protein
MSYLQILVGGLLPFLGHRPWWWSSERVDYGKQDHGNTTSEAGIQEDSTPFSWGCLSAGSMRTKCNPPSWNDSQISHTCCTCILHAQKTTLPHHQSARYPFTYQPSSPATSFHANQPSSDLSAASIALPAPVVACLAIFSLCRPM